MTAPKLRLSPGCRNCCEPGGCAACTICSDPFTRADSTTVGNHAACPCNWGETVGDWAIAGNELTVPTANAFLQSGVSTQYFRLKVNINVDTTRYRVIYGYVDANNYYFFEIVNGAAPTLNRRSSGANTVLATSASTFSGSGMTAIEFCAGPEGMHGWSGSVGVAYPVPPVTGSVGLGTGSTVGTPKFDDVEIKSVVLPCDECVVPESLVGGCGACQDVGAVTQAAPRYMQLDVTGVTNGSFCSDCASKHNASFILDLSLPHGVADCNWFSAPLFVSCPGALQMHYTLQIAKSGADIRYDVRCWQTSTMAEKALWSLTAPGAWPLACTTVSGVTLPIVAFENPAPLCFFGSSSVQIWAL